MALATLLRCRCPRRLADELGAELIELGAGGVEERRVPGAVEVVTWIEERALAERLGAALTARLAELREHDPAWGKVVFDLREQPLPDWNRAWLDALEPVWVTPHLRWRPEHAPPAAPGSLAAGQRELVYRPAVVFGDGSHVTTRLAAAAVEAWCAAHPGARVLDVGTGNGVLALVAAVSGAAAALGLDVDPAAVATAEATAALNGLTPPCTFAARPLGAVAERFDLVVANIDAAFLLEAAAALAERVAPGGALLVTGLLDERVAAVSAALEAAGLGVVGARSAEGWSLVEAGRLC